MKALEIYKCSMPSSIDRICYIIKDIINYLEGLCGEIDPDTLFEIKVVLNELLLNAIVHGNKKDYNKAVRVTVALGKSNDVYFIIEDEGGGYDCRCTIDSARENMCTSGVVDMKETGRGMVIVESLCEKVRFNKKGNRVVAIKSL